MSEDNNKKFIEFLKKVLLKLKPRFSFHYVAYTIMTILVVFSVIQIAKATTPNPGHPWAQIGDGVFAVTNNQTALRTYTFPNADATVLTTNAPVTLAQGGTGSALADPNADSFMFWDDSEGVTTWIASNSFVTDETDPHALLLDQATPQTIINGAPTFSANLYSPKILGGTGTTDDLTLQTTSGVGTTGADMHFKVGSNGGTEAMTILNSGKIGIINTNPLAKLQINSGTPSSTPNAGYFDMYVGAGDVEFDGAVHFDSAVYFTGSDLALGPVYLSSEGNDLKYAGDLNTVFARNSYRHSYFDHPASSNPFVYINSGTDPDVSNNQWGGMTHDTNNFIISTGINTGVGTAPTTIENAITFAPRGIEAVRISGDGSVGIGTTSPTATLHLKAGTATENTAPLKFTAGTNLTTPEAGAMEWDGTNLFITQTSGPTRKTLAYTSDLTTGYVPYTGATGNVNLGTYSLISPTILGGSATTADLTLQTTSGVGTTGADMHFKVGNNGGTEAMTILNDGNVGIGTTGPTTSLHVRSAGATNLLVETSGALDPSITLRPNSGSTSQWSWVLDDSTNYLNLIQGSLAGTPSISIDYNNHIGIGTGTSTLSTDVLGVVGNISSRPSSNTSGGSMGKIGFGPGTSSYFIRDMDAYMEGIYEGSSWPNGAALSFYTNSGPDITNPSYPAIERMRINKDGFVGIGITSPTATLHLKAGTATANTAPLKFTAGTNLTTPEAGTMEWDGTNLFITQTTGPTRKTLAYTSDLTTGYVPYTGATGNVNLGTYSLISPTILGGSATTADLTLQTTSGVGTTGADMHFKVGSNGGTEAMTILNSGNVGVGTTNPGEKIEVNGNIYINNASGYLKFQNGFKFSNGASDVTVTDSGNNTIMIFDEL